MKRLLLPRNLGVLAPLAHARALLAFDFDGTLAPIVARREAAAMRRSTAELFRELCARYPTAVISGRGLHDLRSRLAGANVRYAIGNHGLEPGADTPANERALTAARATLARVAAVTPGLDVEDKRYSLSVHYRRARHKAAARAAVVAALAHLPSLRVVGGKDVINVLLASAPNKGDAMLALRQQERAERVLFVGDDVTDEDVFRLDAPEALLSVRVEPSRTSAAAWCLRDQREVDRLLAHLVALRR